MLHGVSYEIRPGVVRGRMWIEGLRWICRVAVRTVAQGSGDCSAGSSGVISANYDSLRLAEISVSILSSFKHELPTNFIAVNIIFKSILLTTAFLSNMVLF